MSSTQTHTSTVQVTCIKQDPYVAGNEGITHVGGQGWMWTREQVIAELESPNCRYSFFTSVNNKVAWVEVVNGCYRKHLQIRADGYLNNNLLALGQCY